jgi:uncharacterized repeat protein (TIGR03803 family)
LLHDSQLFGVTLFGGSFNGGTVFAIPVPEPSAPAMLAGAIIGLIGRQWRARRRRTTQGRRET